MLEGSTSNHDIPTAKLPAWIKSHFRQSIDSQELLMQIIEISKRGISVVRGMPELIKALSQDDETKDKATTTERLARAESDAVLASNEVETDFPVLHSLAVVALWSWLEHFVKGFVALWLLHHQEALNAGAVQKLRVRLGDYLQLDRDEQAHFLVELLEQETASPLKRGVMRFDSLLEPFGLTFTLPDGCGKLFFELQQVRNAIAHRNGRADRRLLKECPWLEFKINDPVRVSTAMLGAYSGAAAEFALALFYKVRDIYNVAADASRDT